ncbi:pentapeptide repeat-containing protein [Shimazuella alba]
MSFEKSDLRNANLCYTQVAGASFQGTD